VRAPIIALDIDGVLNSARYFSEEYGEVDGRGVAAYASAQIDPAAVAILNRILAETGADVVVSSTWRLMHRLPDLRGILRRRGFAGRIIGRTPYLNGQPRGLEIQAWLDAQREQPPAFAIVDDDEDMAHLSHRLVRTTFAEGLTEADVSRLIAMLRGGS
jgi:hypothetical protein